MGNAQKQTNKGHWKVGTVLSMNGKGNAVVVSKASTYICFSMSVGNGQTCKINPQQVRRAPPPTTFAASAVPKVAVAGGGKW